jgi:hypothetical protein
MATLTLLASVPALAGSPTARPAPPPPAAYAHADEFLARFGAQAGLFLLALGALCVIYGVYAYPRLGRLTRSLAHVAANVAVCGLALYLAFGAMRSGPRELADMGFLAGHVIVVGMIVALVSGLLVAFAPLPDEATCARWSFRLRRYGWGVMAGFVAAPLVGMAAELAIAAGPGLRLAAPQPGLALLGEVFGIVAGWLIVAPVTGLLNMARACLEGRAARLPQGVPTGAGVALALLGAMVAGWFVPFSQQTAHAMVHTLVMPLALR